jgi:SynChlorMet cassette protein ScmC
MPPLNHNGATPGDSFFAAYIGPSMNPTLCEPELMEISPYGRRPLRVGDVAFFLPPGSDQPVVHRIIRLTPAGIITLGDNNTQDDPFILKPEHIKGQVVAAWRGQKRRKIPGGLQGRVASRWLRCFRGLDHGVSPLLHPLYQALSRWGFIAWLLPAAWRPRVVGFHSQGREQFQLLLGRHIIGRYDDKKQQWQIQRPFHLLVDGKALPRRQDRDQFNEKILTERKRAMAPLLAQGVTYTLALADESHWSITAGDEPARSIVSQLGRIMQLSPAPQPIHHSDPERLFKLLVQVESLPSVADCYVPQPPAHDGVVVCLLDPNNQKDSPAVNLTRLSLIIAREAQARGGVLIHGALAERDGCGVILTAPGGTGKTTASNRFPAPWRSLCDDTTLVVKDAQGNYQAHPWPTWSRFLDGGPGGTWNVQSAVPLKGIFLLAQAPGDRAERVGPGHAVSLLVESVRQASMFMPLGLFKEEIRALNLERFNNLCALARVVPAHVLHISLTGTFWEEIDKAIKEQGP